MVNLSAVDIFNYLAYDFVFAIIIASSFGLLAIVVSWMFSGRE